VVDTVNKILNMRESCSVLFCSTSDYKLGGLNYMKAADRVVFLREIAAVGISSDVKSAWLSGPSLEEFLYSLTARYHS
jgi:hypothetical protein